MPPYQLHLSFGSVTNSGLFSNHWLEHRLRLEPEWEALQPIAAQALERLEALWAKEHSRVTKYGDEQGLEYAFIQPTFKILGWHLKYQTFLDGREPDYALFLSDAALGSAIDAGRTSPKFWDQATLVADAKAWDVNLDRPQIVRKHREYPPQQLEWYLDRSRCPFGILTNGRHWQLYPRIREPHEPRFQTFYRFDLAHFLDTWTKQEGFTDKPTLFEEFLQFFLFFSLAGFSELERRRPFVIRAREGSSEYRLGVGRDLKDRTFEALRLTIEGFLRYEPNGLTDGDLETCRHFGFILLYRLLFIMFAEDRSLLPYNMNSIYTKNRSLGRLRLEIAKLRDTIGDSESEVGKSTCSIYEDLLGLFDLIDRGHRRYGVPAYDGGLFDPDRHSFLEEKRISDWYLSRIIDHLGRAVDPQKPKAGLFRVDFRDLAIQHLGAIYEGLLELHPTVTADSLIVAEKKSKGQILASVFPATKPLPKGFKSTGRLYPRGSVYLETEKGERRSTGSYYTPDHIVNYLVERTLTPLCKRISDDLGAEIEDLEKKNAEGDYDVSLRRLRTNYDDRILKLRILDPAIGSGHFLIGACRFLAEEISTHPYSGHEALDETANDELTLAFWKRQVAERCLFGVDVNPLALELAKLALWLETISTHEPLTFLDHHLRVGNSLIGAKVEDLGGLPSQGPLFSDQFHEQLAGKLDAIADPLSQILDLPSDTTQHLKEKQALLRRLERVRSPFRKVADLWCAQFALLPDRQVSTKLYQRLLELLKQPVNFARFWDEENLDYVITFPGRWDLKFFHWQLEFPEVLLEHEAIPHIRGFDAVIGNPPYDVVSAKETGHDVSALKAFLGFEVSYAPSAVGKNNLYKLFICRAIDLLADGGRLGFITPMPLLGDQQASGIRKMLLKEGTFTSVEAFPQKDNPHKRIFFDAKLSTAAFTYLKTGDPKRSSTSFVSRRHPENVLEEDSPSLTVSGEELAAYDPENLTIVAASQSDWDTATAIGNSSRLTRLGTLCTSFQGEINETTDAGRGIVSKDAGAGPIILRGSNITLYLVRDPSQGEERFLNADAFQKERGDRGKAAHPREHRLGFQRSSPQNNFRRLIAALIPPGEYCFDTISYVPESRSKVSLHFLVALLNSKLLEWYFRLGSTNSKVNEYQFNNLPCPVFETRKGDEAKKTRDQILELLRTGDTPQAFERLKPLLADPPFDPVVMEILGEAAAIIQEHEKTRGKITKRQRARLSDQAGPCQQFIDQTIFALAGLPAAATHQIEQRLGDLS